MKAKRAKLPKLPVPSEHESQVAFFRRVDMHPMTRHLPIYAVPNGGHRHKAVAAKMKREGVRAGVLDINVDVPRTLKSTMGNLTTYHGLRIEMKKKGNKPTPAQRAWAEKLQANGFLTDVCYSSEESWHVLTLYLGIAE